jgi:hypothetical protein
MSTLILMLIIVGAIVVIAGGWYYWKPSESKPEGNTPETNPSTSTKLVKRNPFRASAQEN